MIVWNPELPIAPELVEVETKPLRTEGGRVLFANSITLTPGTVSVRLDDDTILVHALTRSDAEGVQDGSMRSHVAALEPGAAGAA